MAKVFELDNKMDRELGKEEIAKIKTEDGDLKSMIAWQVKYVEQLASIHDREKGVEDKLIIYGTPEKFNRRKETSIPLDSHEVYDLERAIKSVKDADYEIVGGLGGFSFFNGIEAGELTMMPGGTTVRSELRGKQHFSQNVPPTNIYPMALMTARKIVNKQRQNMFVVVFEKGENLSAGIKEVASRLQNDSKTLTGTVIGSFSNISGYVFSQAAPMTKLKEISEGGKRNLFIYQTLLGYGVKDFEREVHSHGFEVARLMDKNAFGAHIYDAQVADFAIGIFGIAESIERY